MAPLNSALTLTAPGTFFFPPLLGSRQTPAPSSAAFLSGRNRGGSCQRRARAAAAAGPDPSPGLNQPRPAATPTPTPTHSRPDRQPAPTPAPARSRPGPSPCPPAAARPSRLRAPCGGSETALGEGRAKPATHRNSSEISPTL